MKSTAGSFDADGQFRPLEHMSADAVATPRRRSSDKLIGFGLGAVVLFVLLAVALAPGAMS